MGNAIYVASPFEVFLTSFTAVVVLLLLGVVGVGSAILRRNQGRGSRIALGAAGIVLVLAGSVTAVLTLNSMSNAAQSIFVRVGDKRIAQDNCGDSGQTCSRYVLEATTSTVAYDFDVPQRAYDSAQVDTCYRITYYPSQDLFATGSPQYHEISSVMRIETAEPAACQ